MAKFGGVETFSASLYIDYTKSAVTENNYSKQETVEGTIHRQLVKVDVTAPSLEKLQEKLVAYVGLAEV